MGEVEDEVGGGEGGLGSGVAGEAAFLLTPEGGVVGEEVAEGGGEGFGGIGEGAAADGFEELEVALFLTGDEVMDEDGAAGGKGFMDGGAASLADDEVVVAEEFGDFFGPTADVDAAGVGVLHFAGPAIEFADIAAEDDGDFGGPAGVVEDGAGGAADGGAFGGGKEEDAEWFGGILGGDGGEGAEALVDGEAGFDDAVGGDLAVDEAAPGFGIGDEPVVGGGLAPGGVDVEGIGDDGDDGAARLALLEGAVEEVGVERVGADDDVGSEGAEAVAEGVFDAPHEGDVLFGEVAVFDTVVDARPGARGVGGDEAVAGAEEFVHPGGTLRAGIDDFHDGLAVEGPGEVPGGAVMAIAESRGGDQDAGEAVDRHLGRVVPGLEGCVDAHFGPSWEQHRCARNEIIPRKGPMAGSAR